jgi:hypothetical protein
MIEYKCPYCGQDSYAKSSKKSGKFDNWKSVRTHTSRCKQNTQDYMICEFYGPIAFAELEKYNSLYDFSKDYPNSTFHASQWKNLRLKNKSSLRRKNIYSKESIIQYIKLFYSINKRIPQARDFKHDIKFPNEMTVIRHFDSWNNAIEAAGFTPSIQNGFGIDTYANDGKLYRSSHEAYFVDHFLFEKEEYQYEKPYGNGWYYDFYLPKYNLYIELDGGLRPQRIEEKRKYHLTHGVNCSILKTEDIYKKDFKIV